MLDPADQVYLVEELVHPLVRVKDEPLDRNDFPIWQNALVNGTRASLAKLSGFVEEVGRLL